MTHHDNKPKAHHFVPQMYMSMFTNSEGKLFTIDLDIAKKYGAKVSKGKYPAQLGYEDMFYEVKPDNGFMAKEIREMKLDPYYVEQQVFKELENNYSRIINKVLTHEILSVDDAIIFSEAFINFKHRNRYQRKTMKPETHKLIDDLTDIYVKAIKEADTDQKEEKIKFAIAHAARIKEDPEVLKELHVGSILYRSFRKNGIETTIPAFLRKLTWHILYTDDNNHFIASDNPGFCTDPTTGIVHNVKFGGPFLYCLPLNPNNCLVIKHDDYDEEFIKFPFYKKVHKQFADPDRVLEINASTMAHVDRYILAAKKESLEDLAIFI